LAIIFGVWRSPVAHLVWDQRVEGSNPFAPNKPSSFFEEGLLILEALADHKSIVVLSAPVAQLDRATAF
jgi:hypothetical protein